MSLSITLAPRLKDKPTDESKLGFGRLFTDHMAMINYTPEKGWHDARIVPYQPLSLDPATMVLHYAQEVFEGLKAYRHQDGSIHTFRARDNFTRMQHSCERLCMPAMPVDMALEAMNTLLDIEKDWVPHNPGTSLYIRPTIIATDPYLGVRASESYLFYIILSPVGLYYPSGLAPVDIYVESSYVRAVRGGVGFAKTGGNYAASILAGDEAKHKGYAQVLWLDGVEQKYVEEVGSMNIFFVIDGELYTPALNGSVLPGITRDSVMQVAAARGLAYHEKRISMEELLIAGREGRLQEVFGSGTAAVISPVGKLMYQDEVFTINGGEIGPITKMLYDTITGTQYGLIEDTFHWTAPAKP